MVAPYSTVGGYGGNPTNTLDPNTGVTVAQVDTQDGYPVTCPALVAATGQLIAAVIDPTAVPPAPFYGAMPEINAILIELRVLNNLLMAQLGATQLDLEQMRADEVWNTGANGVV